MGLLTSNSLLEQAQISVIFVWILGNFFTKHDVKARYSVIAIFPVVFTLLYSVLCRFHILGDFDEGKRSCRRKLERHNNRRRRKVQESGEDTGTPAGDNDNASPSEGLYSLFCQSANPGHIEFHEIIKLSPFPLNP